MADAGGEPDAGGAGAAAPGAHLILVGLPGVGKSSVGREVARRLGRPFVDLDAEIERAAGCTIAALFEREGEAHFRAMERAATAALRAAPASVVAPGGGWIMGAGLVELVRPPAYLVHLFASPATALARMGEGVHRRPLLRGDAPLAALERLWAARAGHYAGADHVVDTERLDRQGVIDAVAALASPPAPR